MSSNPFCCEGFNDCKHAADRISFHENSKNHRKCLLTFFKRSSEAGRIDTEVQIQISKERVYWRNVLTRIVSVVRFLTERGLLLRDDCEKFGNAKNGNYLGLLELLSDYNPFLKEHINKYGGGGSGKTSYLSHRICDECIDVIGKQVFEEIVMEVKTSKYYSFSVDSTSDAAHMDQLTFVIRYLKSGEPKERFLKFIPISAHTADHLFHEVTGLLNEMTLLSSLTTFISKKRDSFDKYLTSAETAIGFKFEDSERKRTVKRSLKIAFFDNPLTPESVHSEKEKLKIDVFLPMIDAIYINLRDRSSKYDIVAKRFGFLEEIITLKEKDGRLEVACSTLAEKYEHDISSNELFEECVHLKCFLEGFGTITPENGL
nr:uncharacterized protein LOC111416177 [Onthophagus taurus]